jgi:sulfate adenylyltransferase
VTAARTVLDDDGLDRLELVLGGWLPASVLSVVAADDALLTDAENTPLAGLSRAPDGGLRVDALAPPARGGGPHWDRVVRLTAAEVRARVGPAAGRAGTVAAVVDGVPTRDDVSRLAAIAARPGVEAMVLAVPVARRARATVDGVGWAGLTRAAWALADDVAAAAPGIEIVRLTVARPPDDRPLDWAAAGITEAVTVSGADDRGASTLPDGELDRVYPPVSARELRAARRSTADGPGAVVFFTGLSGSGKSTIARTLADELADAGPRRVTLLDGDEVRQHLSRGLGFDAASREINIDRIAWVAALVAEHGGIAIAAPIAPFDAGRRGARAMAEARGAAFLLVWVSTPLDVCEARDRKGLYARARAGEVAEFTGISSPYEPPADADVVVDTTTVDVGGAVTEIRRALAARLGAAGSASDDRPDRRA